MRGPTDTRTKSIVRIMMTITMKLLPLTPTHLSRQEKLYRHFIF
jgi:hypothetical protein